MEPKDAVESAFKGSLENLIHIVSATEQKRAAEVINTHITPLISNILRSYGAKILIDEDLVLIKRSLQDLKITDNIRLILDQFIESIDEVMKGDIKNG